MISGQRIPRETQVLDDVAADHVFLDDALRVLRRDMPVPRALWIHHADRALVADAQALHLRAVARTVAARDVQLLHPVLDVQPRPLALLEVGAVRAEADEQMTCQLADAEER